MACSIVSVTMIAPLASMDWVSISRRSERLRRSVNADSTRWARDGELVMRIETESGSCSAWARMSAAHQEGETWSSAMVTASVGPWIVSMPTVPNTMRLAVWTKTLPGPNILSTAGTVSVP